MRFHLSYWLLYRTISLVQMVSRQIWRSGWVNLWLSQLAHKFVEVLIKINGIYAICYCWSIFLKSCTFFSIFSPICFRVVKFIVPLSYFFSFLKFSSFVSVYQFLMRTCHSIVLWWPTVKYLSIKMDFFVQGW